METPQNILIKLSKSLADFAIKRNYKYLGWKYDTKLFGNMYVVMQGDAFDIYVVKDRDLVSVMLGPLHYGEIYLKTLEELKSNQVTDVLKWQQLGDKWYPIEFVLEFLGYHLPPTNNSQKLNAYVVEMMDCDYSKIAYFMRGDLLKSGFKDFVAQKRKS